MFLVWMLTEMFLMNDYSIWRLNYKPKIDTKKENIYYWLMRRDNIWNWIWLMKWIDISNWVQWAAFLQGLNETAFLIEWFREQHFYILQGLNDTAFLIEWFKETTFLIEWFDETAFLIGWFVETAFPIGWWNDHVTQLRACCPAEPNEGGKSRTTSGKRDSSFQ
jgi:hypothetical protein